ncbi:hypothetical protein ONA70_00105 [Micromonospora yasonensis]|uniref:hypothetical protein n=1 Tax=Micromonospora yasonensis TaxID=1128667 RepID=UPI0022327A69|nr:hypothetical protein [Micromonospora yasonensis]MCW3838504.1 hypothetical protein [Micromonospora yasonensis]
MELTLDRPEASVPLDFDVTLQPGESGYFSGEWLEYPYDGGRRFESAYAGTLVKRWNGWAVWSCVREVAEAIVTDQEMSRRHNRVLLAHSGLSGDKLERYLDQDVPPMRWEGDVIVVERKALGEEDLRIEPDEHGRYVVMGGHWMWEEVPVDAADTVHGVAERP